MVSALTAHGYMNNPLRPKKFEVFVDGGVRRATDVMKAIALGATAVGIGRPTIYAMSTYGQEGVSKMFQILKVSLDDTELDHPLDGSSDYRQDEFEMNMRLVGAPTLADLVPSMVDTSGLHGPAGGVTMYDENCEYLDQNRGRTTLTYRTQTSACCLLERRLDCRC